MLYSEEYINKKLSEWNNNIKDSYNKAVLSGDWDAVYSLTSDLDCCQATRSHIRFELQRRIT